MLGLVGWSVLGGGGAVAAPVSGDVAGDAESSRLTVAWVPASCGDGCVGLATSEPLDPRWSWAIQVKARFGPLAASWEEDLHSEGAPAVHALRPPPEAFLHPSAVDYVTDLSVVIVATDPEDGREQERVHAPAAFLAWTRPDVAVVWDSAELQRLAPAGVVSATIRQALGDLEGVDRVGPPVTASRRTLVTDEVR